MCGRVRLSSDYSEIKIKLKFDPASPAPNYAPDWNKPPTEPMLVAIRSEDGKRVPRMMRWGLLPHWAKDEKLSYSTFNARAEEFTGKPAFKDAWSWGQRCLVVTDGFYEWKKLDAKGKQKQPYAIAMADHTPMVMAGLWAKWKDPKSGDTVYRVGRLSGRGSGDACEGRIEKEPRQRLEIRRLPLHIGCVQRLIGVAVDDRTSRSHRAVAICSSSSSMAAMKRER
jgi:putative SOS response-associated peptidase YedK